MPHRVSRAGDPRAVGGWADVDHVREELRAILERLDAFIGVIHAEDRADEEELAEALAQQEVPRGQVDVSRERAPSAFLNFSRVELEQYKAQHPDAPESEQLKAVRDAWVQLPQEQKAEWEAEAASIRSRRAASGRRPISDEVATARLNYLIYQWLSLHCESSERDTLGLRLRMHTINIGQLFPKSELHRRTLVRF
jgi:hypothetical protein